MAQEKTPPNYLIEAYMGVDETSKEEAINRIMCDLPIDHLTKYLEWNGIIGYTVQINNVAGGDWFK